MSGKVEEGNLLRTLNASKNGPLIEDAIIATDTTTRKAKIETLIANIAEELSKLKKGKPGVIEELKEKGNFSTKFNNKNYELLDSLSTVVDPKSNSTEREDVINKIKQLYNKLYVGPGKPHKNQLNGGRKTKKHRKTRKHRRNKTRRN